MTGLLLFKRQQYAKGSAFASYREEWAARVTYGFKNRYLFEANGAYNGSEKFGPGNKFGFFPSVAGGWVISNEKFFREHVKFVDFLKVRYSWGIVGSDEGIAKWLYSTQWAKKNNEGVFGYPIGQVPNFSSAEVKVIGNPDAQWETAYKNDVALEATLFNGLWKLGFDYYWGRRTNIFISGDQRAVPPWFGASAVSANVGETRTAAGSWRPRFAATSVRTGRIRSEARFPMPRTRSFSARTPNWRPTIRRRPASRSTSLRGFPERASSRAGTTSTLMSAWTT